MCTIAYPTLVLPIRLSCMCMKLTWYGHVEGISNKMLMLVKKRGLSSVLRQYKSWIAEKEAGMVKRIVIEIDYAYSFWKSNLRQSEKVFDIPYKRILKVGMIYEL
ncbi:unnamed protein product [Prunus brigantina]